MNFEQGMWVIGAGKMGSALAKKGRQAKMGVKLISRPDYDMTQKEEVERFFDSVNQLPSVIVNTIGMLHDAEHTPEKSLAAFKADWFYESLRVNALPVIWMAQCLSKKLSKHNEFIFIILSARVSSLSDNHLGVGIAIAPASARSICSLKISVLNGLGVFLKPPFVAIILVPLRHP
nr:hypothetical protein [Candidatus Hamiltonella defensa]